MASVCRSVDGRAYNRPTAAVFWTSL